MEIKFKTFLRVWSKVIIISAPELENTSPERQQDVEDMAPKMYKNGEDCVLYLLSFSAHLSSSSPRIVFLLFLVFFFRTDLDGSWSTIKICVKFLIIYPVTSKVYIYI